MAERTLDQLEDSVTEGAARIDAAMCCWLIDVAEFDRRAAYERWECRSTAHFLNWRCGISLHTARQHVRVARALEELPIAQAAFGDGRLSYSKLRALVRIVTPKTEAQLVEWAQCATAAQFEKIVAGRRSVNRKDPDLRDVSWHHDDDGYLVLRARLEPEEGALVLKALQSAREALRTSEDENVSAETFLQPTNADALVAMAETTLAHGPTPVAGGDRHTILIHVDAETNETRLASGQLLDAESAALIRCDASESTILLRDGREPLALGRKSRGPSVAQRRALLVRDGGACRFPGCSNDLFVDAHHVEYWENGGPTDLDNLMLLCRVHHRAIHHRGYRIEKGPRQTFRFYRPDGLELVAAPPVARPTGSVPTHGPTGTPITPDTPLPNWDGHHPDYGIAIEGLLWLEEHPEHALST
jgi:hypothetical protein